MTLFFKRILLLSLFFTTTAAFAQTEGASDTAIFFGRFHPLFVHLPIGFLFIAFLLEVVSRFPRYAVFKPAVTFTLLLGAGSAVAAVGSGYLLSQGGGYDENTLFLHQWMGIGVATTAIIAFVLKRIGERNVMPVVAKAAYLPIFSVSMLLLMGTGHYGGSLTHGSEYLTQYMPQPLRKIAGLPPRKPAVQSKPITNLPEAVVYTDIIHPIFEARCINCHNADKQKGDLRMDSPEFLTKGGEGGAVFVAGKSADSELMKRLLLPEDHDDHMPPEGKTQLTKEQVALLQWWIDQGASFDKKVAQVTITPEIKPVLTQLGKDAAEPAKAEFLAAKAPPAEAGAVEKLRKVGITVSTIAQGSNWLQAKVSKTATTNQAFNQLKTIAQQLTWLDVSELMLPDSATHLLAALPNLTRLHVEKTNVTDAGLAHLKPLQHLEYLNLYGTKVTDAGMKHLTALKNLRHLYVWQTNVTKAGAEALQQTLPNLQIDLGWEDKPTAQTFSIQQTALTSGK